MKSAGKARSNGLYRHIRTSKEIIRNLLNDCYKIIYESGETYDRRRNELSVEISKEDYKKIITGVLQERSIDQIE